jgi:L-ascorbate metabolism protein UlaG (beta-lactamase superfamily)
MQADGSGDDDEETRMPAGIAITWYGHASFGLEGPDGTRVLLDPWLDGPTFPAELKDDLRGDVILLTHGHVDHAANAVELAKRLSVPVLAPVELAGALGAAGVEDVVGFNKGGTVDAKGISFTMTNAIHTGSIDIGTGSGGYAEPAGYVIGFANGARVYAAGDTAVHADMALVGELYTPDVAILPIGDHYTMGPDEAALAIELLGVKRVVPCHWGTFPALTGTPDALAQLAGGDVTIERVEPGDTVTI